VASLDAYDLADMPCKAIETRLTRREFGRVSLLCMLTGSTVFGRGEPKDTDYIAIGTAENAADLVDDGWTYGGSLTKQEIENGRHQAIADRFDREANKDGFVSMKKDGDNIILTGSHVFLDNWVSAHDECCEKRPETKAERVKIFRRHLYGEGT